jgi:hypothetical protein
VGLHEKLAALVDPAALDEWYVTDGAMSVGPVGLDLLTRGIEAGKVPQDGYVRHISWSNWRGLGDLLEHDPSFDPRKTFQVLPAVKAPRPSVPRPSAPRPSVPKPPAPPPRETLDSIDIVSDDEEEEVVDEVEEIDASEGTFDGAADLAEGMLILLATVVAECEAEAALIHRIRDEGAVVVCSHGPRMFELLGEKLQQSDPVYFAARQGQTVLAEPVSGVAGRAIKTRLSRLGAKVEAAFMVPVHTDGRLLALVEVGRTKPFRGKDVAAVEKLSEALIEAVARLDWSREWKAALPIAKPGKKSSRPPKA